MLAPPLGSWCPLLGEILDPLLFIFTIFKLLVAYIPQPYSKLLPQILDVTLRFSSQSPIGSFWVPLQVELAPLSGYHPTTKLREGNVSSRVCSQGRM